MAIGHDDFLRRLLTDRWVKITQTSAAEKYPDRLEFTERGTFCGSNNPSSRWHPIWDAGLFHLEGGRVRLSTSNDAEVVCQVWLDGNDLVFTTPEHGEIRYQALK